eukprot:scaffold33587_cov107-Skeletonema_dohrnii-CCMP3373.AAC.5
MREDAMMMMMMMSKFLALASGRLIFEDLVWTAAGLRRDVPYSADQADRPLFGAYSTCWVAVKEGLQWLE